MRLVFVLNRLNIVVLLHSVPTPHNDWLPIIVPLVSFVILAVAGLALYYFLTNRKWGPPDEQI